MPFVNQLKIILSIRLQKSLRSVKVGTHSDLSISNPGCCQAKFYSWQNLINFYLQNFSVRQHCWGKPYVSGFKLLTFGKKGVRGHPLNVPIPPLNIPRLNSMEAMYCRCKMLAVFNNRCGYSINSFDGLPTIFYNKHCYYLICGHSGNIFWVIFFWNWIKFSSSLQNKCSNCQNHAQNLLWDAHGVLTRRFLLCKPLFIIALHTWEM